MGSMIDDTSTKAFAVVVFQLGEQCYAVPAAAVERIIPVAKLEKPPNAPPSLLGFLNVGGNLLPVLQLHTLFGVDVPSWHLWTPLIVLRHEASLCAIQVSKVTHVAFLERDAVLPVSPATVINDCIEGIVPQSQGTLLLVSPGRLLMAEEATKLAQLQELTAQRLRQFQGEG